MNDVQCTNCMEWEYFEGCGYGCFAMKTMIPLDAEKCEFFANRDKYKRKDTRTTHCKINREKRKPNDKHIR